MFKSLILFCTLGFTLSSAAREVNVNDCGANMYQVNQIIESKFSRLNAAFTRAYLGRWKHSMASVELSHSSPFTIMGYRVLVCPREDKSFVVLWKEEKTKAGVMKMSSRNVITISETKMGTLTLERDEAPARGR